MQVYAAQFLISDHYDRFTVLFDDHEQKKGRKWTVYVTCNGVDSAQQKFFTNATPCPRTARGFANKYSKK